MLPSLCGPEDSDLLGCLFQCLASSRGVIASFTSESKCIKEAESTGVGSLNKDVGLRRFEFCLGHFEFDILLGCQGECDHQQVAGNIFIFLHWGVISLRAENVSLFTVILEPGVLKSSSTYWIHGYTDLGNIQVKLLSEAKRLMVMIPAVVLCRFRTHFP